MYKRLVVYLASILCVSLAVPSVLHAFTLLTEEQALKEVFGRGAEITVETKVLEGEALSTVMERLGGKLVWYQQGSVSEIVQARKKIDFYFASKGGKRFGVAIIEIEPGKWGPITFIVAMTLRGAVKKVRVLEYIEKRGRPIARRSYMNQYRGKTTKSVLTVGRDITGISGATISSRAATFTVKKALILYEEFYLKQ